jgi:hypothetical protein
MTVMSLNDCLMKDVTVLIYSGVDGLSIFLSFSSWAENLNIYFESIGIKCFDYWYFSCIQRKNEIHFPRHCKSHIVFGPEVFWILGLYFVWQNAVKSKLFTSLNESKLFV